MTKRIAAIAKYRTKLREPYGGTWIEYTVNVKFDEDGYVVQVTVTDPDGMEHPTQLKPFND